jgi:hypothetical protein
MNRIFVANVLLLGAISPAGAVTFDFESQAAGGFASVVSTVDGLTLTAVSSVSGAYVHTINDGFSLPVGMGERALIGALDATLQSGRFTPLLLDFSALLTSVSVQMGDGGGDDDGTARLTAYDMGGFVLGSNTLVIDSAASLSTLSFSAPGIKSIKLETFGGPDNLNSVLWDNLQATPIPEPTASGLASLLIGAGLLRRRGR